MKCRRMIEYERQMQAIAMGNRWLRFVRLILAAECAVGLLVSGAIIYATRTGYSGPTFWYSIIVIAGIGLVSTLGLLIATFYMNWKVTRGVAVVRAPGGRAFSILKFLLPRKTFDRVVVQIIADGREEYFEALEVGEVWHARYIIARTHAILVFSLIFSAFTAAAAKIFSAAWKAIGLG